MFEGELKKLEKRLNIPYPERTKFIREIAGDLEYKYQKYIAEGITCVDAKTLALNEVSLNQENINALSEVHESRVSQSMRAMPPQVGQFIMDFSGMVPLVVFAIYSIKEFSMLEFLREGGLPFVLTVLLIGGFGLSLNLKHAFRWFIVRDHSEQSLADFSNGPLYLAAASLLLGVLATAVDYRLVFSRWSQGGLPDATIRAGFAEPLASLIVAAGVAGLIVLLHGWLATWREKIALARV